MDLLLRRPGLEPGQASLPRREGSPIPDQVRGDVMRDKPRRYMLEKRAAASDETRGEAGEVNGSPLPRERLETVERLERVARGERVDVERLDLGADGVALLLFGLRRRREQRQIVQPRRQPAGLRAAASSFASTAWARATVAGAMPASRATARP